MLRAKRRETRREAQAKYLPEPKKKKLNKSKDAEETVDPKPAEEGAPEGEGDSGKEEKEQVEDKEETDEKEEKGNEVDLEGWQTEGHDWMLARVRRSFGRNKVGMGFITRWIPAGEDPEEDPAMWHVVHDDGDEEDLEEAEVLAALKMQQEFEEGEDNEIESQMHEINQQMRWEALGPDRHRSRLWLWEHEEKAERGMLLLERAPWAPEVMEAEEAETESDVEGEAGAEEEAAIEEAAVVEKAAEKAAAPAAKVSTVPESVPNSKPAQGTEAEVLPKEQWFEEAVRLQSQGAEWRHFKKAEGMHSLVASLNPKGVRELALRKVLETRCQELAVELDEKLPNKHMHYVSSAFTEIDTTARQEDPPAKKATLRRVGTALVDMEKKLDKRCKGKLKSVTKDLAEPSPEQLKAALTSLSAQVQEECDEEQFHDFEDALKLAHTAAQLQILVGVLPRIHQGQAKEETESDPDSKKEDAKKTAKSKASKAAKPDAKDKGAKQEKPGSSSRRNSVSKDQSKGERRSSVSKDYIFREVRFRTRGHAYIGREVECELDNGETELGKVTGMCLAGRDSFEEPCLFQVTLNDGEELHLKEYEVEDALRRLNTGTDEEEEETDEEDDDEATDDEEELTWMSQGHAWIGKDVRREYEGGKDFNVGKITKWVQAGKDPHEDPALWHVEFPDGDEEDLEAHEVREAIKCFAEEQRKERAKRRS